MPLDAAEVVVQEEKSWVADAPWWVVSAGLHVVILLVATLVYMERAYAVDEGEVTVMVHSADAPKIVELDKPRDLFERKGIPKDEVSQPTEEPAIFFPEAKEAERNVSADNEEYRMMKGDSKEALSYLRGQGDGFRGRQAGKNPGFYDTMGVGDGGGGSRRYGGRFGGKENLVARGGGSRATQSAVLAALFWLARHQAGDGSWNAETFHDKCVSGRCSGPGGRDYDAGVTGLSLLAFLGAGFTHLSRDEFPDPAQPSRKLKFGEVVKKALQWIMSHQDSAGCVGERGPKYMYNHTISALSLSEAYGMTGSPLIKDPAQRAINFVVQAQNSGKGWRYSEKPNDNDSSVTGWAVMALKSAELSDLSFPKTCYDGALNWYKEATNPNGYYAVGYTDNRIGHVADDKNARFADHPALASVAVMARIFMQKNRREPALGAVQLLVADVPEWKEYKVDFYYWYYGSLALFQYDGPDGPMWKRWNEPMKNALVPYQKTHKDGCLDGSWDPEKDRWGHEGGRVYTTAIGALTLEVYYRYRTVFGRLDEPK